MKNKLSLGHTIFIMKRDIVNGNKGNVLGSFFPTTMLLTCFTTNSTKLYSLSMSSKI